MIRIQIISPFRYQYEAGDSTQRKDFYFAAGDYYHLDAIKDKGEAKYILSPNYSFKNYIYVDTDSIPEDLFEELGLESGFYNTFTLPKEQEYIPTLIDLNNQFNNQFKNLEDENLAVVEPEDNKFDLTSKFEVEVEDAIEQEPESNKEEIEQVEAGGNKDRQERELELEELHYKKVQDIAGIYQIKYSSKKEVIAKILDLEFGIKD